MNLREFPLSVVRAVEVNGLLRWSAPVCSPFAQTHVYIFELPIPSASCRYAPFISARIVPG